MKIDKIRIQNFRSIQDATFEFNKLNLLIGPNNAGKTNFLKALVFFSDFIDNKVPNEDELKKISFQQKELNFENPIAFTINLFINNYLYVYKLEIYGFDKSNLVYNQFIGLQNESKIIDFNLRDILFIESHFYSFWLYYFYDNFDNYFENKFITKILYKNENTIIYRKNSNSSINIENAHVKLLGNFVKYAKDTEGFNEIILDTFKNLKIFKPDTNKLSLPQELDVDLKLASDASNLVSFLDNLRDSHSDIFQNILTDLKKCAIDFTSIVFKNVKVGDNIRKIIGLQDKHKKTYWADEVSEGILYLIAILSIIHQPNPPKLLLIEEPEKNIHPRRINEVLDFILRLTELKNISIILTTHSTLVVDFFTDMEDSIFIFDMENSKTIIRRLDTIINEDKAKSKNKKFPVPDYGKSIGEHWYNGFFGGIPS